jgi:hypothetical protein
VSFSVDARWPRIPAIAAACLSITLAGAAAETAKPLKTGTAEGAIPGTNTGWVMGWKEPLQSGGRRLAFACMVSHLDWASGGPRFGGAVCGALLRDISLSLETMSPPDLRANEARRP